MVAIKQYLTTLFAEPPATCRTAQQMLNELRAELETIQARIKSGKSDYVHAITPFFRAVAEVENSGIVPRAIRELTEHEQYWSMIEPLDLLAAHLSFAGRDMNDMDRVRVGNPITDDTIMLKDPSSCLETSVASAKCCGYDTWFYAMLNRRAGRVIEGHLGQMIRLIRDFDQTISA